MCAAILPPVRNMSLRRCLATLILAVGFLILGASASLQAQNYNPNNYDTSKVIAEMLHPHNDLVMVAAHRGLHVTWGGQNYDGNIPENSLQSIGVAAQRGSEIIEVDIKLTSDGVPILSHDITFGREIDDGFDPFSKHSLFNDLNNPLVNSRPLSSWRGYKLRETVNNTVSQETPPTLDDVLNFMTEHQIAAVLSLDIKDNAAAQACWQVVKNHSDFKGSPYYSSVVFKVAGRLYPTPSSFTSAFGNDYQNVLLWLVFGTADISPSTPSIDNSYGTEAVSAAGFGSEDNIIRSIRSYQASLSIRLVGTEVNLKETGGILTQTLAAAKVSNGVSAASVGSFRPIAEYKTFFGVPQFFHAAGPDAAYCCYVLSDLFYDGSPYNQPSDHADNRGSLNFLINDGGANIITTDLVRDDIAALADIEKRNISYLQGAGGAGGGGTGGSQKNLRLMPLGDSITFGYGSSTGNGYRGDLRSALVNDGFTADFVGENRNGNMYDDYHDGFSGYKIADIDAFVGSPLAKYKPNIITLMLGTNDMFFNNDADAANAPARMTQLLNDIYSNDPGVTVLVGTLIASTNATIAGRSPAFNQALQGVVLDQASQGHSIKLVDMSSVTTSVLYDDRHPNDNGYQKMADAWHAAVQQVVSNGQVNAPVDCSTTQLGCNDPAILAGSQPTGVDPNAPSGTNGSGSSSGTSPKPGPSKPLGGIPGPGAWINRGQYASGFGGPAANIQLADMNGDGKADYVIVSPVNGQLQVWLNQGGDGAGGWSSMIVFATGLAPGANVRLADVNGDGKADYLVVDPISGAVTVWYNKDGKGAWDGPHDFALGVGSPGAKIQFADMNSDGFADYLVVDPLLGAVDVWLDNGGDSAPGVPWDPWGRSAYGVGYQGADVRFADINGDGWADYVVIDPRTGAAKAWLNMGANAAGGFYWKELGQICPGFGATNSTSVTTMADMDGDGKADYVRIFSNGALEVYLNRGIDTTKPSTTGWFYAGHIAYGVGSSYTASTVQFADIDGDGKPDYLSVDNITGAITAARNQGQNYSLPGNWSWGPTAAIAYGVGSPGSTVHLADMDGNGSADYIVLDPKTGGVSVNFNNGGFLGSPITNGSGGWGLSTAIAYGVGADTTASYVEFAHVNGGKKADYNLITIGSGKVESWFNQGPDPSGPAPYWKFPKYGTITQGNVVGYNSLTDTIQMADIDGDGHADYLVIHNGAGGSVDAWINKGGDPGSGWLPWGRIASGQKGLSSDQVVFTDIDGDGKADYLIVHGDGSVDAWLNNGTDGH